MNPMLTKKIKSTESCAELNGLFVSDDIVLSIPPRAFFQQNGVYFWVALLFHFFGTVMKHAKDLGLGRAIIPIASVGLVY